MSMTYLITGATGPIGRSLVAQLLDAGADVRVTTRDPAKAAFPRRRAGGGRQLRQRRASRRARSRG